ncbi:a83aa219-c653-4471-9f57-df47f5e2622a [Sclerotinia trifoliorum]|uniref:A83aa219-c653-4471-9f57-df47f5e2622a n=1 Tax=Sclerotinia trifoliorum TaxID=28548 RepID=A0A8H2ZMS3_9HELO|nr:a83aa219-c653-4471-9f57-df47f5e2622a [Sclerotinia trifoliorum]
MTCFRITRGPQDQQLPLAVGVKSGTVKVLDSRGKIWSVSNYLVCEDGTSNTANSRGQLYEEYLECFRDRINMFNMNRVGDDEKVSWAHYLELIWLHGACQTVRQYRPELYPMFDSRENEYYPKFNPEVDSVEATSMFRPRTLAFGEQAFITAKYPWTLLIARAEDTNTMTGWCPAFPLREIHTQTQQWQGLPIHVASIRESVEPNIAQQQQLYAASPTYSISEMYVFGPSNPVYQTIEGSQHTDTTSADSTIPATQKPHQTSEEEGISDTQSVTTLPHQKNASIPIEPKSPVPEHLSCAVQIRVNSLAQPQEILNTIRTGAIYSLNRVSTSNHTSVINITFMTHSSAQNYITTTHNNKKLLIRNKRVAPCENKNVSRVLKITRPARGFNLRKFIHYARSFCGVDYVNQWDRVVVGDCEVVVEFASFEGQAAVVWEGVRADPGLRGFGVEFLRDLVMWMWMWMWMWMKAVEGGFGGDGLVRE